MDSSHVTCTCHTDYGTTVPIWSRPRKAGIVKAVERLATTMHIPDYRLMSKQDRKIKVLERATRDTVFTTALFRSAVKDAARFPATADGEQKWEAVRAILTLRPTHRSMRHLMHLYLRKVGEVPELLHLIWELYPGERDTLIDLCVKYGYLSYLGTLLQLTRSTPSLESNQLATAMLRQRAAGRLELDEASLEAFGEWIADTVDPEWTDDDGNNLLHIAAQAQCDVLMRALIRAHVDPTQKNEAGDRPLDTAIRCRDSDSMRALIEESAEVEINVLEDRGSEELSPLHLAAMLSTADAVELLLKKGVDVDMSVSDHGTPLHSLIGYNWNLLDFSDENLEKARLLLTYGARVSRAESGLRRGRKSLIESRALDTGWPPTQSWREFQCLIDSFRPVVTVEQRRDCCVIL